MERAPVKESQCVSTERVSFGVMEKDVSRFPLRVTQSLGASIEASSGVLVEDRNWFVTTYCDVLQVHKVETNKFLTFVGNSKVVDKLQQRRGLLDAQGFASLVFDDVVAVAALTTREKQGDTTDNKVKRDNTKGDKRHETETQRETERLLLIALHRSGIIRSYRQILLGDEETGEEEETGDIERETDEVPRFKQVASWHFGHGTPRFIAAHGSLVAVATVEGSVSIFQAETGTCTHKFSGLVSLGDVTTILKFHPRRLLLLLGTSKGTFVIMDLIRQCVMAVCPGHDAAVTDAAFVDVQQSDGSYAPVVVTGSRDKWLKLWELKQITDKISGSLKIKTVPWGLSLSLDEQKVEETSSAKKRKGTENQQATNAIKTLFDQDRSLKELDRRPAAQCHVSEEIESLCVLTRTMIQLKQNISGASWFVCIGGESGRLRVWDLLSSNEITEQIGKGDGDTNRNLFGCPLAPVRRLFRGSDGKMVLVMGNDMSVVHWDTAPIFRPTRALKGASGTSTSHCVFVHSEETAVNGDTRDGETAVEAKLNVLSSSVGGTLQKLILNLDGQSASAEISQLEIEDGCFVAACDVDVDGKVAALALSNGQLEIVYPESGAKIAQVPIGVTGPLTLVRLSKKPRKSPCPSDITSGCPFVAAVGADHSLRIWKFKFDDPQSRTVDTPTQLETADALARVGDKSVYAMAVAPNDKIIVTGGADKKLKIWQVPSLQLLGTCVGHKQAVTAIALSPVEQIAVSAGLDMTLKIWNLKTFEVVKSLVGFESSITCLNFMLDGIRLIGGCTDGRIHIWDTKMGLHLGGSQRHGSHVSCVSEVSPGVIASCSQDGAVLVWSDQSAKVAEEDLERKRQQRNEIANVDTLLSQNRYRDALKLSLKWRRLDLFEKVLYKLADTVTQRHQTLIDGDGDIDQDFARLVGDMRDENGTEAFLPFEEEQQETILMAALHFCKTAKKLHFAQFIANLLLKRNNVLDLRKLEGFGEFVATFNAKTESHIDRLERLREKSFLVDLILAEKHLASN